MKKKAQFINEWLARRSLQRLRVIVHVIELNRQSIDPVVFQHVFLLNLDQLIILIIVGRLLFSYILYLVDYRNIQVEL